MSTMLEDLSEVVRIIPEDQHKHIPAAEWSDLWEYHKAVSGEGDLAYTWQDKPHRLVYNLTRIIAHMRITYRDDIAQNAEDSRRLKALIAMRDRWATDEREFLNRFGQHLPTSLACLIEQFDGIMRGGE